MIHLTMNTACMLYEDFVKSDVQKKANNTYCEHCNVDLIMADDSFKVCPKCGSVDFENVKFQLETPYENIYTRCRKTLYKRRLYCREKLSLITCNKNCNSKHFKAMIKVVSTYDFDTVDELREILRDLEYQKYYKFIYSIYFQIKKVKLITLTSQQIDQISLAFVAVDVQFRKFAKIHHNRSNIISYNSIIYMTMKRLKIKGSEHIILPQNHRHMEILFDLLNQEI